jgi:hypothetical protein
MKDTKRALRRHHRQRMIVRAMRSLVLSWVPEEDRLRQALRFYKNRKKCSCYMCGNQRKWWGTTVQERRQAQAEELDPGNEILSEASVSDNHTETGPKNEDEDGLHNAFLPLSVRRTVGRRPNRRVFECPVIASGQA